MHRILNLTKKSIIPIFLISSQNKETYQKYAVYPNVHYNPQITKFTKMTQNEYYNKIIEISKIENKYKMSENYDYLIMNCIKTEDNKEILQFICKIIANNISQNGLRYMKIIIPELAEEIIKVKPEYLLELYSVQTLELCIMAIELSNGYAFRFMKPSLQTYELVLKMVSIDGTNIQYIREDLIDSNIINIALSQNSEAIQFIKNPKYQNYKDDLHP